MKEYRLHDIMEPIDTEIHIDGEIDSPEAMFKAN
jgi:hypothetical protein